MNTSNDLHRRAMDEAALALMERMRGNTKQARTRFERALDLELAAIAELEAPVEPTFSVLHRSAATLALDCNQFRRAEKLVATALAHEPPRRSLKNCATFWSKSTSKGTWKCVTLF